MKRLAEHTRSLAPPAWTVAPRALWPFIVAILVAAVAYYLVGPNVGGLQSKIILLSGINIILAVSLTVVNGFTGQFSMGHAGLMAVGGYTAASITYYGSIKLFGTADFVGGALSWTGNDAYAGPFFARGDFLFLTSCLIGGLTAAVAGYLVGLPSLRLRGDYLAIVTLGFGEIVRVLLQGTPDQIQPWKAQLAADTPTYKLMFMLGGPKGFNLLPTYTTLFWVYFFVVITLIACYRLKTSSSGRAFLSIREDEVAAQAMGVDITRYKVRAFVLASFFAGVAGGLYAMDIGAIAANDLGFQKSFDFIIMVVLGGMGSISGATLAAVILTVLPEALRKIYVTPLSLAAYLAAIILVGLTIKVVHELRHKHPVPRRAKITAAVTVATLALAWIASLIFPSFFSRTFNLGDVRLLLYAFLLIAMMILRPQGLFGVREIWELIPSFRRAAKPKPN